ncbi:ABC transporter permease, partial [Metamycoplasma equirhinis]|uniref:ABC transporter permease n=1 Tax=Metamycoplasma equirhinis TaxID=92402 RepID=UPI0035938292
MQIRVQAAKTNKKTKHLVAGNISKLQISLLIPYILFAILFIILPMVLIFIYALKPIDGQNRLDNWDIIAKRSTWLIIFRSLWTGIIAATFALIIGFPYAYIISKSKSKIFRTLSLSLMLSPMAIFTISKALAVRGLFSAIFDENYLNNNAFAIFGMVYLFLPFMIMPLYQVLKDMPKNILEASEDLGYSKIQTIFKVILPYCTKAILSGFGVVLMMSATSIII